MEAWTNEKTGEVDLATLGMEIIKEVATFKDQGLWGDRPVGSLEQTALRTGATLLLASILDHLAKKGIVTYQGDSE